MMMRRVIAVSLVLIGLHTAVGSFRLKSRSALLSCPADLELDSYAQLGKKGSVCETGNRVLPKLLRRRFQNGLCAKGHECCRSASGIGLCNLKEPCDSSNGFVESPTLGCLKYSLPGSVTSYEEAHAECLNTDKGNDLVSLTNRKEFLEVLEVIHPAVSNTGDFIAIGLALQDLETCTFITASGGIVTQDSDLWVDPVSPEGVSSPLICNTGFQPTADIVVGITLDRNSEYVPVDIPINFSNIGINLNVGYICQKIW